MRKIVFGRDKSEVALSVDIADNDRQALAYSMLYHMMENGAAITAKGKTIPAEKERLWLLEQDGDRKEYIKPHLDPEWFGANGDQFERDGHLYSTACMTNDYVLVKFMPMTVSYDKANEMNNFMLQGLDPGVSISYLQDGEMKQVVKDGRPIHEGMVDENGSLVTERYERDWVNGKASEIITTTDDRQTMYVFAGEHKYEILTDDTRKVGAGSYDEYFEDAHGGGGSHKDRTVYRIRALRDFGDVKAGDLGGYIECEQNLSHSGNCWVYDGAAVCCDAVVKDDATVRGNADIIQAAVVSGNANVFGDARVTDNAVITDHAQAGFEWDGTTSPNGKWKNGDRTVINDNAVISGNAQVLGEVVVCDNAKIGDNAYVEGKWPSVPDDKYQAYYICCVRDNAVIDGNAKVTNTYIQSHAHIYENAVVSGHQKMGGHVEIGGNAEICGDAKILHNIVMNGDARISGRAEITDKITVGRDADIRETGDYFTLKTLGKNSYAVRNQNDGVTIVHKGKSYDSIDSLKTAVDMEDPKIAGAVDALEEHFGLGQDFADAVASIPTDMERTELGR